jgi:hypothetical protein
VMEMYHIIATHISKRLDVCALLFLWENKHICIWHGMVNEREKEAH